VKARWKVINVSSCLGDWAQMVALNAAFYHDGAHFTSGRDVLENEWRLEDAGEELEIAFQTADADEQDSNGREVPPERKRRILKDLRSFRRKCCPALFPTYVSKCCIEQRLN